MGRKGGIGWVVCQEPVLEPPELPALATLLQPEEGAGLPCFRELWGFWEGGSVIFVFLCCISSTLSRVQSIVAAQQILLMNE